MSNDIIRYKPQPQTSWRDDPQIQAGVFEVLELLKVKNPKKYAQIQRQKAHSIARKPIIEAMMNDPKFIAELDALELTQKRKKYGLEYELLGIEPNATKRDVKNAYRRASRRLHPDSGKPTADAEKFKQVHEAYRKLLKVAPNK